MTLKDPKPIFQGQAIFFDAEYLQNGYISLYGHSYYVRRIGE